MEMQIPEVLSRRDGKRRGVISADGKGVFWLLVKTSLAIHQPVLHL